MALTVSLTLTLVPSPATAGEGGVRGRLAPRVPADELAAAKKVRNPMAATPDNLAKGKVIYEIGRAHV